MSDTDDPARAPTLALGDEPAVSAHAATLTAETVAAERLAAVDASPAIAPTLVANSTAKKDASGALATARTLVASAPAPASVGSVELFRRDGDERYERGAELARGGMGRIVAARDRGLDRPVALKELLEPSVGAAARFAREVRITARLQHPAIVPVYEAGIGPGGQPFFAMRKVDGEPLDRAIARRATLAQRLELLPHLTAVAEALAYAHSRGVLHRDLKPANVLVGEFGETVVIDWGIACEVGAPMPDDADAAPKVVDGGLTLAGSVMGTPAYMPPEQARGEEVDARADVYALGAMLFELLTGEAPYDGASSLAVLAAVLTGTPSPLARLGDDVPAELRAIAVRAMARERDERYANAQALAADLSRFQTGQLVGAHRYTTREVVLRWMRRHRAALSVAAVAAAILAVLSVGSVIEIGRERDAALDAQRRAEAASASAETARQEAVDGSNRATLARARAAHDDPAEVIAVLHDLSPGGSGWSEARALAAEAVARGVPAYVWRVEATTKSEPTWSRDGRQLAFVWGDALVTFDVETGTHRVVTLPFVPDRNGWTHTAFGEDGRVLVLMRRDFHGEAHALVVSLDGASVERIDGADADTAIARVLPSERALVSDGVVRAFDAERDVWVSGGPVLEDTPWLWTTDGRRVVEWLPGTDESASFRVWSFGAGAPSVSRTRQMTGVVWGAFSPDLRWVFALPGDGRDHASLIDLETGETGAAWPSDVHGAAFTPDSARVAVVRPLEVRASRVDDAEGDVSSVPVDGATDVLDVSNDGRVVANGREGFAIAQLGGGGAFATLSTGGLVGSPYVSPDGRWLATGGRFTGGELRVWDLAALTGEAPIELPGDLAGWRRVTGGEIVVVWGAGERAGVLRLGADGRLAGETALETSAEWSSFTDAVISGDGSLVAASVGPSVNVWDAASGARVATYDAHGALAFDEGSLLQIGSASLFISARGDAETRTVPLEWVEPTEPEAGMPCRSPARAEAGAGGAVIVWTDCSRRGRRAREEEHAAYAIDVATGRAELILRAQATAVLADGGAAVVGVEHHDGVVSVVVWDVAERRRRSFAVEAHQATAVRVVFAAPDPAASGETRVVLDIDGRAARLRTADGSITHWREPHLYQTVAAGSPDGERVALGAFAIGSIDLGSGAHAPLASMQADRLMFSGDGRALIAVSGRRVSRIRDDLPTDREALSAWLERQPMHFVDDRPVTEVLGDVHPSSEPTPER